MNAAATRRRIARLDYLVRAMNGGHLPKFEGFIDDDCIGYVVPYDGTPETALDLVRAKCRASCTGVRERIARML